MGNLDIQINVGYNSLIVIKSVDFSKMEEEGTMDVDYDLVLNCRGESTDDEASEDLTQEGMEKFTQILEDQLRFIIDNLEE